MAKATVNKNGLFTSLGKHKAGDVINITQVEIDAIEELNPGALSAEKPAKKETKKTTAKKKRARNADGTLKADDPSTSDVNEAWEDG